MGRWNYWPGGSLGNPPTSQSFSSGLTILRPPLPRQLPRGSSPSSPAGMEVSTPLSKKPATSTTQQWLLRYTDTAASKTNAPSSSASSTAFQMHSPVFTTSSTGAASAWSGHNSPSSSDISRTRIHSPPLSPMSTDAVETLVEYVLMMEHLSSGREVSPPAPGSSWTDWSHAWETEMRLKKALEKLNLEYPRDSND
jgi:hypothetical protein